MKTNSAYIILVIILFTIVSGCNEEKNTQKTTSPDPKPAQDAIRQAQSFLQTIQSDLSTASIPVNEAKSKGVDTTNSSTLISNLQKKLSNIANDINTASNEYKNQNYLQAKIRAEQSITNMKEVQNQIKQIKQTLENDYKATTAKYKPRLIEAERQYKITEKYIKAARKVGIDTSGHENRLQGIMTRLNQVKEYYKNNNFNELSSQIDNIISTSQQIQNDLKDLYYNELVINQIKKSAYVSQEARNYLSEADSLRREKNYQKAVYYINKASLAENQAEILENINKLKNVIFNMGFQNVRVPKSIDYKLRSLNQYIENGEFGFAKKEIEDIKKDVTIISEDTAKVADARKIINETSKLSFWWAENPDISSSSSKLAEAERLLVQEDHTSAADKARTVIDMANNERILFWNRVKSDWILGRFLDIGKMINLDPEEYEFKAVERPKFEWKNLPELINIDFSVPIVDISDIIVKDPETPIMPVIKQSQISKRSIYFKIDPGSPTECGTTCRRTTATLTNTGEETAKNVNINLNINNNQGESVYSTQRNLGNIPGGQSRSEVLKINADCGSAWTLYSKCRDHMPLILNVEITWDGGNQLFTQQFSG